MKGYIWRCLQEEEVKRSQAGVFMDHARKVGGSQSQVQEGARKWVAIEGDQRCIHMSPQDLVTWTSAVGLAGRQKSLQKCHVPKDICKNKH